MLTRRLAESVEGLNSSLALVAGNLWPKKGRPIAVIKGLRVCHATMHSYRTWPYQFMDEEFYSSVALYLVLKVSEQ